MLLHRNRTMRQVGSDETIPAAVNAIAEGNRITVSADSYAKNVEVLSGKIDTLRLRSVYDIH